MHPEVDGAALGEEAGERWRAMAKDEGCRLCGLYGWKCPTCGSEHEVCPACGRAKGADRLSERKLLVIADVNGTPTRVPVKVVVCNTCGQEGIEGATVGWLAVTPYGQQVTTMGRPAQVGVKHFCGPECLVNYFHFGAPANERQTAR